MSKSKYRCPICGKRLERVIKDMTVMYHCDEHGSYEKYELIDDLEIGGVPRGCAACGGPYPDCKTSCKLFDD